MKYLVGLGLAAIGALGCGGDVQGAGGAGSTGAGGHGGASSTSTVTSGATGTGGESTSTSTGSTSSSTGSTSGSSSSTGGMGCGVCAFSCCGNACVNTDNDIHNCGFCGKTCAGPNPFCDKGNCTTAPCMPGAPTCATGKFCCNNSCCDAGDLCCEVPGPVEQGPMCVKPTAEGTCPLGCKGCVCNSPDTLIATPSGNRRIDSLKEGDLVYSVHQGRVVAVPVRLAHSVAAPDHVVMQVTLGTGVVLEISPKHPTADGRVFGELRAGAMLDGLPIVAVRAVPFRFDRTYDILPDSDTGTYFAGGALIGSTLAPNGATVRVPTEPLSPAW